MLYTFMLELWLVYNGKEVGMLLAIDSQANYLFCDESWKNILRGALTHYSNLHPSWITWPKEESNKHILHSRAPLDKIQIQREVKLLHHPPLQLWWLIFLFLFSIVIYLFLDFSMHLAKKPFLELLLYPLIWGIKHGLGCTFFIVHDSVLWINFNSCSFSL